MMTSLAAWAPLPTPSRRIALALLSYPKHRHAAVHRAAAEHPRLADLALSFPALLQVIASSARTGNGAALKLGVVMGMPLPALAAMAGLPLWLRKLPPQACGGPFAHVPADPLVCRQIGNCLPKRQRHAALWLHQVMLASRWGTPQFALWIARLSHDSRLQLPDFAIEMMGFWAWHCERPQLAAGRLCTKPLHPRMSLKKAQANCNDWVGMINLHLAVSPGPQPSLLREGSRDGLEFIHLNTAELIDDEARRMGNCMRHYGRDVSLWSNQFWSIRRHGASVASLCISPFHDDKLLRIAEIKGPHNVAVDREVALAARRWFQSHDIEAISGNAACKEEEALRPFWIDILKPYWRDKGERPDWLRPSVDWHGFHTVVLRRPPRRARLRRRRF